MKHGTVAEQLGQKDSVVARPERVDTPARVLRMTRVEFLSAGFEEARERELLCSLREPRLRSEVPTEGTRTAECPTACDRGGRTVALAPA
jgi:hypothetical protein